MEKTVMPKPWKAEAGWLDGMVYDNIFILGVAAIALLSGAIVWNNPSLFYPVLIADLWLLGYHHVIATFTKMAGTKEDRQENKFLIYQLPLIVLAGVTALYFGFGIWAIVTTYFFWQWFHYTRQAYGIAMFYRRKAIFPTLENKYLTHLAIWSIPVWGLLHRCSQGWDEFLFLPVWMPAVPDRLVLVAGVVAVGSILWWLLARFVDFKQGRLSIAQTAFVLSHFIIFYVGYIAISDINIGWLVANVWHNAQYILFVWLYNTNRFGRSSLSVAEEESVLKWFSERKPVRILFYFLMTLILTSIFYQSLAGIFQFVSRGDALLLSTLYVVGYQTVNFHHYVVDGIIWKGRNRKNQRVMQLQNSQ